MSEACSISTKSCRPACFSRIAMPMPPKPAPTIAMSRTSITGEPCSSGGYRSASWLSDIASLVSERTPLHPPVRVSHLGVARTPSPQRPPMSPARPARTKAPAKPRKRTSDAVEPVLEPLAPPAAFAPITTERLILRPFKPEDAESLHRLVNDWEVTRNLAVVPFPYPRDLADRWIESTLDELAAGSAYHLAITGQEGDKEVLVGVVGLRIDDGTRLGNLGYWVGRRFWGHGVATEAAGRLVRWSLANLPLDRLVADVADDNP